MFARLVTLLSAKIFADAKLVGSAAPKQRLGWVSAGSQALGELQLSSH